MEDVFKILKDLEYKAVGVDPDTDEMPEGYFVSFRPVGLPIIEDDFKNPWTPTGSNMSKILSSKPQGNDGDTIEKSASQMLDEAKIEAAGIGDSMMAFLRTFSLTDSKLSMNKEYSVMPNSSKISDSWYAIITGANGMPDKQEVNDSIKKAIDDAKAVLADKEGNPSPKFELYVRYRDEYNSKVRAYQRFYSEALSNPMKLQVFPIQGKLYQDDIDFAMEQWSGLGEKHKIEKALKTLEAQGIDPAILLIARAKHKYQNSLVNLPNIGNIPYTTITPSRWYDRYEGGWTAYSSSDFKSKSRKTSSSESYGGNAGFNLGFWSIGGGGGYSEEKTSLNIEVSGLDVSFEYATVDINRPWLDTSLLNLSNWFLVGDYNANCISDGTFGQNLKGTSNESTFMPSITTSLVLIRNLKIGFNASSHAEETLNKSIEANASVGWGPFKIGGNYKRTNSDEKMETSISSRGIGVDGVQLIGYVSSIIPASPRLSSKDYMQEIKEEVVN